MTSVVPQMILCYDLPERTLVREWPALSGSFSVLVLALTVFLVALLPVDAAPVLQPAHKPTFYNDVLPILQDHCQTCHRPGEVAPMALVTYEQTRPWAGAMAHAVDMKMMPPWFADPRY